MGRIRTSQGLATRRRNLAGLLVCLGIFSLAYLTVVLVLRELAWPALSELIADLTSSWFEVRPEESAELYRLMGLQEGMRVNGATQFRDLTTYHRVVALLKGSVLWGLLAVGLVVVAAWWTARCARDVDELAAAVGAMARDGEVPDLPSRLSDVTGELRALAERERLRERASVAAESRKNELVAYLAHDIRTPLTSVVGYLSLLAEEPGLPPERVARYAGSALDRRAGSTP